MEQRNEPSTAEIVRALRNCHGTPCETCVMRTGREEFMCSAERLADRLEQLERDNALLRGTIEASNKVLESAGQRNIQNLTTINELTARAENAEAERDAANRIWREWYDNEGCGECSLCRKSKKTCGHFPKGRNGVNGCEHFEIDIQVANKCFFNRYTFKHGENHGHGKGNDNGTAK